VYARLGLASIGQSFDGDDVFVDISGVEFDALIWIDSSLADFVDLRFREGIVVLFLCEGAGAYEGREENGGGKMDAGTHEMRSNLASIQSHHGWRGNERNSSGVNLAGLEGGAVYLWKTSSMVSLSALFT